MVAEKERQIKVLFLYTELAGYTIACLKALSGMNVDIHLVRWPVNKEAPFDFVFPENCAVYERNAFDDATLLNKVLDINPDIVYCSGWVDKGYLKACKAIKDQDKPVIVGFDNQWTGSLKQYLAGILSPFYIKKYFNYAWIPGEPQYKFAKHLGFKDSNILKGVYAADTGRFDTFFHTHKEFKSRQLPHRFLYVGRYVDWKGLDEMWKAFDSLEDKKGWELWCAGTGEGFDSRPEIEGVRHIGFVQPEALGDIIKQTSVFVLPSRFEPWGVVLHEYAMAGYPILSTSEVGASSAFLEEGVNGWYLKKENVQSIKEAMQRIIDQSDEDLIRMGEESRNLALKITPESWAKTLLSIV